MNKINVELDWGAYYKAFCQKHGEPVPFKGRLLFPDGWQYSSTDHRGPEWQPPQDFELRNLRLSYWVIRRREVKGIRDDCLATIMHLRELMSVRDVPLQQTVIIEGEDGERQARTVDFSLDALESRLAWCEADLQDCERTIEEIKHGKVNSGQPATR